MTRGQQITAIKNEVSGRINQMFRLERPLWTAEDTINENIFTLRCDFLSPVTGQWQVISSLFYLNITRISYETQIKNYIEKFFYAYYKLNYGDK